MKCIYYNKYEIIYSTLKFGLEVCINLADTGLKNFAKIWKENDVHLEVKVFT